MILFIAPFFAIAPFNAIATFFAFASSFAITHFFAIEPFFAIALFFAIASYSVLLLFLLLLPFSSTTPYQHLSHDSLEKNKNGKGGYWTYLHYNRDFIGMKITILLLITRLKAYYPTKRNNLHLLLIKCYIIHNILSKNKKQ